MRGGRLDRKAQRLAWTSTTRDGLNNPVESWVATGPAFAVQQLDQRPTEAWKAGQSAAQLETGFRARWTPAVAAISPRDRLLVDGRTFEVIGLTEPKRRAELTIACISIPNP